MKYILLSALLLTGNAFSMNVTAQSWLVADGNGKIIQSERVEESRSIASITKLLTVMVVLDANQDVNEKILMTTKLADGRKMSQIKTYKNFCAKQKIH